jgi:ADP-ribose pyrophosphatase YjhB (NUDIX family)
MRQRRFCPFCASPLSPPVGSRQGCIGCGTPYYLNAAPCVAVLVERDGSVLLARRGVEPALGRWDLPGGFCEPDEEPELAALRELREETGATVAVERFLGHVVDVYGEDGDPTLNCIYVARLVSGEPEPDDDVAELRWFRPDELPPDAELAFANTAEALRRWRHG